MLFKKRKIQKTQQNSDPGAPPRVLIISQPKAGTNLLPLLLENYGLHNAYVHLDKRVSQFYDEYALKKGWDNPRLFDVKIDIEESIKTIRHGQIATTHLVYSDHYSRLFGQFKKIYLRRELREGIISYAKMFLRSNRGNNELREAITRDGVRGFLENKGRNYIQKALKILDWREYDDVLSIKYEDLQKKNLEVKPKLTEFLEIPSDIDILSAKPDSALFETRGKDSLTKNKSSLTLEWDQEAESIFKALGGVTANNLLGYPE